MCTMTIKITVKQGNFDRRGNFDRSGSFVKSATVPSVFSLLVVYGNYQLMFGLVYLYVIKALFTS